MCKCHQAVLAELRCLSLPDGVGSGACWSLSVRLCHSGWIQANISGLNSSQPVLSWSPGSVCPNPSLQDSSLSLSGYESCWKQCMHSKILQPPTSSHYCFQVPLTLPGPRIPWRSNTIYLTHPSQQNKQQTASSGKKKMIAAAQIPIRPISLQKIEGSPFIHDIPMHWGSITNRGKYHQHRSIEPRRGHTIYVFHRTQLVTPYLSPRGRVLYNKTLRIWTTVLSRGSWGCMNNAWRCDSIFQTYEDRVQKPKAHWWLKGWR